MVRYPLKKVEYTGTIISQMTVEMRSKRGFSSPNIRPDVIIRAAIAFFDGGKRPRVERCLLGIDIVSKKFTMGGEPL